MAWYVFSCISISSFHSRPPIPARMRLKRLSVPPCNIEVEHLIPLATIVLAIYALWWNSELAIPRLNLTSPSKTEAAVHWRSSPVARWAFRPSRPLLIISTLLIKVILPSCGTWDAISTLKWSQSTHSMPRKSCEKSIIIDPFLRLSFMCRNLLYYCRSIIDILLQPGALDALEVFVESYPKG